MVAHFPLQHYFWLYRPVHLVQGDSNKIGYTALQIQLAACINKRSMTMSQAAASVGRLCTRRSVERRVEGLQPDEPHTPVFMNAHNWFQLCNPPTTLCIQNPNPTWWAGSPTTLWAAFWVDYQNEYKLLSVLWSSCASTTHFASDMYEKTNFNTLVSLPTFSPLTNLI